MGGENKADDGVVMIQADHAKLIAQDAAEQAATKAVADMHLPMKNMAYEVGRQIKEECRKEYCDIIKNTLRVDVDNTESVEKLQDALSYAKNKVATASEDKKTVRAAILTGLILWLSSMAAAAWTMISSNAAAQQAQSSGNQPTRPPYEDHRSH